MALTALETTEITDELRTVFTLEARKVKAVMIEAGVAGQAAKSTDVQAVVATVLTALYGQTAPTVLP
jgi:riboflavin biosynthesis pyrimidine reductase